MDPFADVLKSNKNSTVTTASSSSDPFADVLPPTTKPSPEQVAPRPLGSEIITIGSKPAPALPQLPPMESVLDKTGLKGVVKDTAGNLLKKLPSLGLLDKVSRGVKTAKELSEGKPISDKGVGKAIQPLVGAVNITGSLIQGASNIPYQNFMKKMYEYQALPEEKKSVYATAFGAPKMPRYASALSNFGDFSKEKLTGIGTFLQEKSGQDPQAFDNQVLQALGGVVPFLATSYAGGTLGLGASILSNSAINAEDVYEENLKQGKTQEEALKKYTNTFNSSLVLNSILTTLGVQGKLAGTVQKGFKQKGIEYVKDVLAEVFEENGEQIITNFNTGKPWATGLKETTLVTIPVAMITGGLGIQSSKDLVEKQDDIKQKEQEIELQKLEMIPNIDPKTQEEVLAWQESYNFITEVFQQNEKVIETPNAVIQVNMTPFGDGKYAVKLLIDDGQFTQEIDFNRIYNSKEEAQQAVTRNEQILGEILAPEELAALDVAFKKKDTQGVEDINDELKKEFPEVDAFVSDNKSYLELNKIIVPKNMREKGIGTKFMNRLIDIADKKGIPLTVTPGSEFGGTKSRLVDFYKRFGFKKNTNLATRGTFIREVKLDVAFKKKDNTRLSTTILEDLQGRETVSKQYILDATNRGEIKQQERDIIRQALEDEGTTVNVADFTKKVQAELLPLKPNKSYVAGKDLNEEQAIEAINAGKEVYGMQEFMGDIEKTDEPLTIEDIENEVYEGFVLGEDSAGFTPRYENIALPSELRGNVKNYYENIYESPIKTSAGDVHFGRDTENYFGHTRIEDMADGTRRVIEVQTDLFQKGRLEQEKFIMENKANSGISKKIGADKEYVDFTINNNIYPKDKILSTSEIKSNTEKLLSQGYTINDKPYLENLLKSARDLQKDLPDSKVAKNKVAILSEAVKEVGNKKVDIQSMSKLQQYSNPTAHFRMVREEVKTAAEDGIQTLQFPTGETAMKIEGLGENTNFYFKNELGKTDILKPESLKVGMAIEQGGNAANIDWIITDVLGDGKFKAVPKDKFDQMRDNMQFSSQKEVMERVKFNYGEQFDISGKVDTNNPIYRFYEKDLGKYLKNKYGAKLVTDDQGVTWYEVDVKPEYADQPVAAFKQTKSDEARMINRERAVKDLERILKRLKLDLDVQFVETILTPELETAYGVYYDGVVSFTEFITDTTVIHEIGHAIFKNLENIPMFKGITRKQLYAELRKEYPTLDEYDLEERLMDKLEDYYGEVVLNKPKTLTGKIRQFLEKTFNAIKGMFSNQARTAIDDFIERTVLGESDTEVTLPSTGDIDKYLKGDTLSFEGFERPKFLSNRVSQARIEKEFEAMFKKKETFGQGVKVGRADMKNKYANMTVEQARKRQLEDIKRNILERNYYKQGLDAVRNNIPPTERFGFMKQLAKVNDSSTKFTEFLSDVYERKAQLDILKGEKRVTAMKRSKIGFLRKVNELDPALIRDIKQMFNIRDVYKRGDKKGLPKENLKPITQYTSEELDMFIAELNKRISYLRTNGYLGQPTMEMLDSNDMEDIAKLAVKSDKRLKNKTVVLGKKFVEQTREVLKTLENRLKFAPEIYDGIRRMEMEMKEYLNNFTEVSTEFAKTYKKLDPVKQKMLDAYLYSQEWQKAEDLMVAEGVPLETLTKIRTILDDIYAKLTSVGIDVAYLKDYFPRYLRGEVRDNSDLFEKMLDKKREKLGRTETEEELANTAVTFLRGFANGNRILLSDGRFVENRLIDKITDPDIMNMYETSPKSLEAYVEQAIKLYVEKKFFNKLDPNLTQELATSAYNNAIADYTDKLQLEGKITGAQNQELREVLNAYFSITQSDPFSSALRNVASMLALGKILSAVPQLIESFISVSEVGPISLVKGFMNIHKIGLEDVLADTFFEANEISLNKVAKVVTFPMRAGDYVAGRSLVNALFQDIRTMAKKGDKETLRLFERLFGDEGARYMKEFGELPSDISGKDLPMFAKDVINSQVRKYRVTGRLEKSATFIKNPNITFLKSYMAKMLNEIVYRGNDEMLRGYRENDPKLFTAGLRKKMAFAIMLMIAGVATSAIRDLLRNKDLKELPDYVFTTLFSLFGLSYYGVQNFKSLGIGGYVIDALAPATATVPLDFADNLRRDITKDIEKRSYSIEDYKTLQALPLAGDVIQFFQNKK